VDIRLLGSLEVMDDSGATVVVSGAKLRSLLAMLALRPGQVVSADRLVDELWGDDPPAAAANSLQVLVSKLRRTMPRGTVVTRAPGYVLDVAPESVDVVRFAQFAERGRAALGAGEAERAAGMFREALRLWRGEALAEFVYEEFAQAEIARLGEERVSVLEDRVDADLACGRHGELVGELEEAVGAEPLRERRRAQLMLSLYRSGRQADALRQFQEARRVLGDELGLEPGPELRRLEAAMLAQDPTLDPAERAAPTVASPHRRSNLRTPLTRTVGRERELADLRALIDSDRLITIVGPGGVGKTRLAVDTARSVGDSAVDGAWFVDLSRLTDPDAVVPAIATTLEVPDLPGFGATRDGGLDRLADFLANKNALVVLDNCEHVIAQAARVVEGLLGSCVVLRFLATSREPLGVPGERLWPAPPLSKDAAVTLFAERASAVDPTFRLAESNRALVADICDRVDGLPLAVELAAARVRAFPVVQLAARLDDRFRLLSGGTRTALARQQSLRAVVDWSYDLLFEEERRLFERMSVFAGGCNLEGAVAVCADGMVVADEIPDLLARLVDKSVLVVDNSGSEARFSMLQTLAQYAGERLAASEESERFHQRHCRWFSGLVSRSYAAVKGEAQAGWIRSVTTEVANLRVALGWAARTMEADAAVTIAGGLAWYWLDRGEASEGLRWLRIAFECTGDASPRARCHALVWRRLLSLRVGLEDPGPPAEEIVALAEDANDAELVAWTQVLLAEVALSRGGMSAIRQLWDPARQFFSSKDDAFSVNVVRFIDASLALLSGENDKAERLFSAAVQGAFESGSLMSGAIFLQQVSTLAESRGDYALAFTSLERAILAASDAGFAGYEVTSLTRLANLADLTGDPRRAQSLYSDAYRVAQETASQPLLAETLSGLALRHRHAGRLEQAEDIARRALLLYRENGFSSGVVGSLCTLGFISESRGNPTEAESLHRGALSVARGIGDTRALAVCMEGLAGVALLKRDDDRVARLLGAAAELRAGPGLPPDALAEMVGTLRGWTAGTLDDRFDAERIEAAVRERLDASVFEKAHVAGATADVDELIGP
jgi:predicted ATPase/DNA-binding SARP family transcriptional activator